MNKHVSTIKWILGDIIFIGILIFAQTDVIEFLTFGLAIIILNILMIVDKVRCASNGDSLNDSQISRLLYVIAMVLFAIGIIKMVFLS